MTESKVSKIIGAFILGILLLLVLKQVYVGGEFVPGNLNVNPIFTWLVAGMAIMGFFIILNKWQTRDVKAADFVMLVVAIVAFYYVINVLLPELGWTPSFALQSMISP